MIEEVLPNIFCLKIPLPHNPLGVLNSYLIKGPERKLLIDTGFNWPECRSALLQGIAEAGVSLDDLEFLITHVHADHSGLLFDLAPPGSVVYASKRDADELRACFTRTYWEEVDREFRFYGFPQNRVGSEANQIKSYISGHELGFIYLQDGTVLEAGGYHFTCIMTPGHTPGHVCLYDSIKKVLISGDHILPDISPNITMWLGVDDPLGDYLNSLDRIDQMEIELVLPGHRGVIRDCRGRIQELRDHHRARLDEIMVILENGAMDAYRVASRMTWDLNYSSWDEFPPFQRWFATGEAVAHLQHLLVREKIIKIATPEKFLFALPT